MKKLLFCSAFALALMIPAADAAQVFVHVGPPRPRREVIIARPSHRHVWVPGAYRWDGGRYNWASGYWAVPPRPRAVWVPGYWAPRHRGYVFVEGYWR
jgi:hypothetical protein